MGFHEHAFITFATYLSMGKPKQLTRNQAEQIKKINDSSPVSTEIIKVKADAPFSKELDLRENDVFFLNMIKL